MPRLPARIYLPILFLTACRAWALPAAPAIDPAIAPFIGETTLGVGRFEPGRIDMEAVQLRQERYIREGLTQQSANNLLPDYRQGMTIVKHWLRDFTNAGGRVIYGVVFMHISVDQNNSIPIGGVLIAPLGDKSDAKAIASLFVNGEPGGADHRFFANGQPQNGAQTGVEAIVIHHSIVFGMIDAVEPFKNFHPSARPPLAAALADGGDAPFVAAFAPTFPFRILASGVSGAVPTFPPNIASGVSTAALINGFTWASLSATPPPNVSLRATLQCRDAASAQVWAAGIDAALEEFRQMPRNMEVLEDLDAAIGPMRPDVLGSKLSWGLNEQQLTAMNEDLLPFLNGDQQAVAPNNAQVSLSNEKQLILAIHMYADDHGGALPDRLAQLSPYVGGNDMLNSLLTSPFDPSKSPGYVYIKPGAKIGDVPKAAERIIIYDAGAPPRGMITVGFLDGHCQRIMVAKLKTIMAQKP
jgi:hypothetical protein